MTLRTSGDPGSPSGLRHRRFRLAAVLIGAALLLTVLAGGSGAGISAYQGTMYLDGAAGSVSGNFVFTTSAGPAQGTAPAAMAGAAGSGGITGTYTYVYVTSRRGAVTAGLAARHAAPNNAPVPPADLPGR